MASARHHHHHRTVYAARHAPAMPLAYAPMRAPVPLKTWMHNPFGF